MTGWNMPPGCTYAHLDAAFAEAPCVMCGRWADDCLCPECPTCGSLGEPHCYVKHGLVCSAIQIASKAEADAAIRQDNEAANAAYWEAFQAAEQRDAVNNDG